MQTWIGEVSSEHKQNTFEFLFSHQEPQTHLKENLVRNLVFILYGKELAKKFTPQGLN